MSGLNWIDLTILAIFFLSAVIGLARGLVREVLALGALLAAFIVAAMFAKPLAQLLLSLPFVQGVMQQASNATGVNTSQPVLYVALGISYISIFLLMMLIGSLFSLMIGAAFQTGVLGLGNRIFGAAFGLARGFIITVVLIFLMQLTPAQEQPWWKNSRLIPTFEPAVAWLTARVMPSVSQLKKRIGDTLQSVDSAVPQFNLKR